MRSVHQADAPRTGVLVQNIPEELRQRRQWVVWKLERRDHDLTKVPYLASGGGKASSTDSETWRTFEEALQALDSKRYNGVGFVFSSGDPYAVVDLDDCRDPETGDLEGWAQEIVEAFDSYTETSPSGTGVHIIVRGKAPNKKRGKVEAYSLEKFFTVTGRGTLMRVRDRQAELDALTRDYLSDPDPVPAPNGKEHAGALSDTEILELCRKAKNAAKFSDLYDAGDTYRHHDGDDSRADQALASMFAFYTQERAQLERLVSGSALGQRAKWRNRADYRRRTIDKALSGLQETYSKPRVEVRSRSQSLGNEVVSSDPERSIRAVSFRGREKPGPREWIVDRAICKGHPASWYGESGIAKSLLAAHMGLHVASDGIDYWAGLRVKTVPVIYGDFELDEVEHLRRAQELAAGMGLPDVPAKFHYLPLAGLPVNEAFQIAAEECARLGAGLFVVDSVGFALDGDSELAKDVLRFYRECIQPIREASTTPFLIDHQAKVIKGEKYSDKLEFGSVYKTNAVRSSFQIRGSWDGNELTATFTHKKTNFGPKVDDFSLKLVFEAGSIEVVRLAEAVPNPDREPSKKDQVLDALEKLGRATSETVANKTGINPLTVRNEISKLLAEELLVDTGEKQGRFRVVATHSHTTQGPGPGPKDTEKWQETKDRLKEQGRL
jgi:putative DNA primase/helicase